MKSRLCCGNWLSWWEVSVVKLLSIRSYPFDLSYKNTHFPLCGVHTGMPGWLLRVAPLPLTTRDIPGSDHRGRLPDADGAEAHAEGPEAVADHVGPAGAAAAADGRCQRGVQARQAGGLRRPRRVGRLHPGPVLSGWRAAPVQTRDWARRAPRRDCAERRRIRVRAGRVPRRRFRNVTCVRARLYSVVGVCCRRACWLSGSVQLRFHLRP